ncbi:unnamed protein product [Eruca vesicaria subsp. sativa]|uniref:Uncharacterized protein n=1 Tax=Eruca vesicaria subsp. sativa TaxID=29727 RepID=A0ABC8J5K3_ERUVS|nr:unnamed protein product [Eruca vesicaria subsp. sativa]
MQNFSTTPPSPTPTTTLPPSTIELCEGSGTTRHNWVISIRDKLEQAKQDDRTSSGKSCIYKVPRYLHRDDKKLYLPQTVSLGPYHYGQEQTSMECHKWRAVNKVLERTMLDIVVFLDAMVELEEKARACYEGTITLNSNMFTLMLVRDGCFVLELLTGCQNGFSQLGYEPNDPVFGTRGSFFPLQRDMILLENQLPLFVLSRLLELQLGKHYQTGLVVNLVVRFFEPLMPTAVTFARDISSEPSADELNYLHCVDVFRGSLLLPNSKPMCRWPMRSPVRNNILHQLIPSATELRAAKVQFRSRRTGLFWDIKFNDGCLDIPTLVIHDGTKYLFSNLIAFEQCHVESSNSITSYCIFMNNLIDSAEVVSYFEKCGIIEHTLGSHSEVVDMFNQLCQGVIVEISDIYLYPLFTEVSDFYHSKWPTTIEMEKQFATLRERYFYSPWAYLSFFAAIILLVLTASQTYFAAYDYYH